VARCSRYWCHVVTSRKTPIWMQRPANFDEPQTKDKLKCVSAELGENKNRNSMAEPNPG
jgi:hypothetical protein